MEARGLGSLCCDQRPGQWPGWGVGRGGRGRGGAEDTGSTLFPQSLHQTSSPEQNTLFQFPLTHPYLSPFSPLEELSRSWWRPAAAASGDSDRRGWRHWVRTPGFYRFVFPCLFLDPNMKIKKNWKKLLITSPPSRGFPGGSEGKESACNAGDVVFNPWVGKVLCRREWLSTPVFLPGEFHRRRSLAGHSP